MARRERRRWHGVVVLHRKLRESRGGNVGGKLLARGAGWHVWPIARLCAPSLATVALSVQIIIQFICSAPAAASPPLAVSAFRSIAVAPARTLGVSVAVTAFGGSLDDAIGAVNGLGFGGHERCDGLAGRTGRATPAARARRRVGRQVTQTTVTVVTP